MAIGKRGQNVRLAAKLTGWKIDVRSPKEVVEFAETEIDPGEGPARSRVSIKNEPEENEK